MLLRTAPRLAARPAAPARARAPRAIAVPPLRATAAPASADYAPPEVAGAFAGVKDMASFQAVLSAGAKAGKVPEMLVPAFMDFYNNYRSECEGGEARGTARERRAPAPRAWPAALALLERRV